MIDEAIGVQEFRLMEPCADCPDDYGSHQHKAPHKCTVKGCGCQGFKPKQTDFQRRVLEDEAHGL